MKLENLLVGSLIGAVGAYFLMYAFKFIGKVPFMHAEENWQQVLSGILLVALAVVSIGLVIILMIGIEAIGKATIKEVGYRYRKLKRRFE